MKSKTREYIVTGITETLRDGQVRSVTLVGVLKEDIGVQSVKNFNIIRGKNKVTEITTEEWVDTYSARFSIGLSVVNPTDVSIQTKEEGVFLAKGRALKLKKALAVLNTTDRFFGDDTAHGILQLQLARIMVTPDKFIKVSAKKYKSAFETTVEVRENYK
jgi:hypothetical protein